MNKKLIFMGTGPFALTALQGLWEHLEEGDTLAVYTKEAKKAGRGMKEKDGCVALFAKEKELPLYQPHSLKEEEAKAQFLALDADLVVVASYGLILPPYVIHGPRFGCVNIHASLLPRHRGAAPINRAILEGDAVTGVTIMQMDEGLDTGDMLKTCSTPIGEDECVGELFERLAEMGRDLLLSLLPDIWAKRLQPIPQDDSLSTYAGKITREDQELSFYKNTKQVLATIRGLSPIPCALCHTADGQLLKIFSATAAETELEGVPGQILAVKPQVLVKTVDGAVALGLIQPEGKGRMNALDAVNGRKLNLGDILQ
ncbi:MAG: methionyl-tRNA formyltransferase [Clostridia bacterium]|nr:methionyl-tRNA formyltransferase [Clostridia bacterium]